MFDDIVVYKIDKNLNHILLLFTYFLFIIFVSTFMYIIMLYDKKKK